MENLEDGSYEWFGTDYYKWKQITERQLYAPEIMHVFERLVDHNGKFSGPTQEDIEHMFYCMKVYEAPIKLTRHHVYFFGFRVTHPFTGQKLIVQCFYFKSIFNMIEE